MLEINEIEKTFFANGPDEVKALCPTSLQVSKGDFISLIGANGSGKSTLQNLIAGSIFPDRGTITLNGKSITGLPDYKRSRWIARVFQDPLQGTAPALSMLDNFRLASLRGQKKGLRIGTKVAFQNRVREQVARLGMGLENKIHQGMGSLSGGQRQALTLLMTVMSDLELLLLDEPTAALDPRSASKVMELADQLAKEHHLTVLFVTHNMKEALAYGNRLIQLSHGTIRRDLRAGDKEKLTPAELYEWFNED